MKAGHTRPCHTCPQRTWRSLGGFMVMGCGPLRLRFGIAPDLARGHVNKAGGCVAMPQRCDAPRATTRDN